MVAELPVAMRLPYRVNCFFIPLLHQSVRIVEFAPRVAESLGPYSMNGSDR